VAPAARSVRELADAYVHSIPGDLSRIRQHEKRASDAEATLWLVERAIAELKGHVKSDGNGGYRLVKDFDKIRYKDEKLIRLVDTDADDEKRALRAMYNDMREERTFYVTVVGAKGGKQERAYRLHPLARAIPQVAEKEFLELAVDVKAHGVRVPIVVFDGQVLDGRHRLALAAALEVPVRVDEFTGTEDEARDHVISMNVKRRHLTVPQRGLIVRELYLPQARAEAAERKAVNAGDRKSERARMRAPIEETARAAEIAAEQYSRLANVRTIQTMAPVDNAPETKERIRSGEITTATAARREALKEIGNDEPEAVPKHHSYTAWRALGRSLHWAGEACESLQQGERGDVTEAETRGRINEIRAQLDRAERLI